MSKPFLLALGAAILTASCGISGPLETAPPMWGKARSDYEAERAKQEAARKAEAEAKSEPEVEASPPPASKS